MRSLLIFGNGLGMALAPNYFTLHEGLKSVWENSSHLTSEQKSLIVSAIDGTAEDMPPSSEEQLGELQRALIATEYLSKFQTHGVSWLSEEAKKAPEAFRKYIHEVAWYFSSSKYNLPDEFVEPLVNYIKQSKSHVVTLNYDNLLYESFIDNYILYGYDGSLIDGFRNDGFDESYIDRINPLRFGWYIHLHGSPLFIGNKKLMREERIFPSVESNGHIVLTHSKHKELIINSSPILKTYWNKLDEAFDDIDEIVLFGYSGFDEHLNRKIKRFSNTKRIRIIEWIGMGDLSAREKFWKKQLEIEAFDLDRMDNILEFKDWDI